MTGASDRERVARWFRDDLPRSAVTWLPAQRWFGGKSRKISEVRVEDVVWLSRDLPGPALVVLDVGFEDARGGASFREAYATLVAIADDPREQPVVGSLPGWPLLHVVEAMADPRAVSALLRGLVTGTSVPGASGGEIRYADATAAVSRLLSVGQGVPSIVPVGADQSNTSIRLGSTHVFKLFRRLEEGEHPQLEIGRFLARAGFASAPLFEGSLVFRSCSGQVHALGALEQWVANTGDGWTHVTAQLRRAADDPSRYEVISRELHTLGETTAAFHLALAHDTAAPAFVPEPVTMADCREWQTRLLEQAERTSGLVERHYRGWTVQEAAAGRAFLDVLEGARERLRTLDSRLAGDFHKIRIHGDFHLGQTLKTHDGFALIDFEGEPARPLADRRRKQCALKDVAGMLRSLDYAWAIVPATTPHDEAGTPSVLTGLRAAFAHGYYSRAIAGSATFLPAPDDVPRWTAVFELEKALYEVEYEINNRPAWAGIPLRAVVRLLGGWERRPTDA